MKRAAVEDLELGNLMFGNSHGAFAVVPREDYQDAFCAFMGECGFDMHGYHDRAADGWTFENGVFALRPYYWGEDEAIAELPNFVYKSTGLEIRWYKYPMRDAYSNQDVSVEDFRAMLADCANSMKGAGA